MREAVIVSVARTPIGKAYRGAFNDTEAPTLSGHVAAAALARSGLDPARVGDVVMGCAAQQGTQGYNIGRLTAAAAGLPATVPGMTVDRMCASGLMAIAIAARTIAHDGVEVAVTLNPPSGGFTSATVVVTLGVPVRLKGMPGTCSVGSACTTAEARETVAGGAPPVMTSVTEESVTSASARLDSTRSARDAAAGKSHVAVLIASLGPTCTTLASLKPYCVTVTREGERCSPERRAVSQRTAPPKSGVMRLTPAKSHVSCVRLVAVDEGGAGR